MIICEGRATEAEATDAEESRLRTKLSQQAVAATPGPRDDQSEFAERASAHKDRYS